MVPAQVQGINWLQLPRCINRRDCLHRVSSEARNFMTIRLNVYTHFVKAMDRLDIEVINVKKSDDPLGAVAKLLA